MASARFVVRPMRALMTPKRGFATSFARFGLNDRANDTQEEHRKHQTEKPLNPHLTNTTPSSGTPSVGADKAPPEFISSVDGDFAPKDTQPENTERMTGGTQKSVSSPPEFDVGEIEGGTFKIEPLRRTGEDRNTTVARLLYQSRKRGTLESDLMLSTFADANLDKMTPAQLQQYDLFLDENDWDIYYWVTQEPPSQPEKSEQTRNVSYPEKDLKVQERQGEWAQTVGTFKPAYRPVPARWRNSEILALLRKHIKDRSAGGVHDVDKAATISGEGLSEDIKGTGGGGLGFMPPIRNFDI